VFSNECWVWQPALAARQHTKTKDANLALRIDLSQSVCCNKPTVDMPNKPTVDMPDNKPTTVDMPEDSNIHMLQG